MLWVHMASMQSDMRQLAANSDLFGPSRQVFWPLFCFGHIFAFIFLDFNAIYTLASLI